MRAGRGGGGGGSGGRSARNQRRPYVKVCVSVRAAGHQLANIATSSAPARHQRPIISKQMIPMTDRLTANNSYQGSTPVEGEWTMGGREPVAAGYI